MPAHRPKSSVLLFALTLLGACGGGGPGGRGPNGLPRSCDSGCPTGYACDDGVCKGGNPSGLQFDLATVTVGGTLHVDGAPPRSQAGCSGDFVRLLFQNGPQPESFLAPQLGALFTAILPCDETNGAFSAQIAPGAYRVIATRSDSNTTFPEGSFVVDGAFQASATTTGLAWDFPTVTVSGQLTVDGAPPRSSSGCSGDHVRLTFSNQSGASAVAKITCDATGGSFSARLSPGTYRVTASRSDSNTTFPDGTFIVQDAFEVAGGVSGLTWNIATVGVSGRLTVDGAPPRSSSGCSGDHVRLTFSSTSGASAQATIVCATADGSFSARLAPGTYRVLASRSDSNTSFPDGSFVVQKEFQVTGAATALAWDIPTVGVSGHLTVDGAAPRSTGGCQGDHVRLSFLDDAGASVMAKIVCATTDGSFSAQVSPGTYRVLATRTDSNTTFPDGTLVAQNAFVVSGAATGLDWNIPTIAVSGHLTVDGAAPKSKSGCQGDHVRLAFSGDAGELVTAPIACATSDGTFSARVSAGIYHVLASRSDSNTTFPDGTFDVVQGIAVP